MKKKKSFLSKAAKYSAGAVAVAGGLHAARLSVQRLQKVTSQRNAAVVNAREELLAGLECQRRLKQVQAYLTESNPDMKQLRAAVSGHANTSSTKPGRVRQLLDIVPKLTQIFIRLAVLQSTVKTSNRPKVTQILNNLATAKNSNAKKQETSQLLVILIRAFVPADAWSKANTGLKYWPTAKYAPGVPSYVHSTVRKLLALDDIGRRVVFDLALSDLQLDDLIDIAAANRDVLDRAVRGADTSNSLANSIYAMLEQALNVLNPVQLQRLIDYLKLFTPSG